MGSSMNYDKYLQNEVWNKLKLSVKCDYNDNKQVNECSRHRQYKVITFMTIIQKFVIAVMI